VADKDPLIHFPFYINQYQGLLAKYSFEEKGAFISLLCTFLSEDGKLPENEQQLFRVCLAFLDTEKDAVLNIKDEVVRIGKEILGIQKTKRTKCREAAKLGGLKRVANAQANAKQTLKRGSSNTETETDTYKETETKLDIDKPISKRDRGEDKFLFESLFEDFWKNYIPIKTESGKFVPKGDKQPAKAKYIALLKASKDPQVLAKEIKEGLSNYLRGCSQSGTLTKHAIRFLRNETWKESEEDNNTFILSEANNETNRKGADELAVQYNFLVSEINDRKARRSSTL